MGSEQNEDDNVSKDAIFVSIVKEAGEFYSLVLTVASAFLGGTLIFLDKIAPTPNRFSLILLFLGWASLISSIALAAYVRLTNLESGRLALEDKFDEAAALDRKNEKYTKNMTYLLIVGVSLIAIFGFVNLLMNDTGRSHDNGKRSVQREGYSTNQGEILNSVWKHET